MMLTIRLQIQVYSLQCVYTLEMLWSRVPLEDLRRQLHLEFNRIPLLSSLFLSCFPPIDAIPGQERKYHEWYTDCEVQL